MMTPSKSFGRKKGPSSEGRVPIMHAREPIYLACQNGLFILPENVVAALEALNPRKLVYLRQDEDTLTISPSPLQDGRRRQLHAHYKVQMFRTATKLALVDMKESIQLMAVAWR